MLNSPVLVSAVLPGAAHTSLVYFAAKTQDNGLLAVVSRKQSSRLMMQSPWHANIATS